MTTYGTPRSESILDVVIACPLFDTKPLPKPVLTCCQWNSNQNIQFWKHLKMLSAKWRPFCLGDELTHWGPVTHICIGKLISIGLDDGLSPDRRQAIIWTNAGLLSIGPFWTYFSENLIKIQQFSLKIMHVKMSSVKWRPSCLVLNVLSRQQQNYCVQVSSPPSGAYMRQWTGSALVQVMACCLVGAKPLPEPMLVYYQLDSWEQISVKLESEFDHFHSRNAFEIVVC